MITDKQREALLEAACRARINAYAPYSEYLVGAAVLTASGAIYSGANVENVSYGLTICAERSAIFTAVSQGEREIIAAAVCTVDGGSPCGACRQVFREFAGDIPIWLSDEQGKTRRTSLHRLLPEPYGAQHNS